MYYGVLVDHNAYHICVMSKILGYQLPYHYWICAKFIFFLKCISAVTDNYTALDLSQKLQKGG